MRTAISKLLLVGGITSLYFSACMDSNLYFLVIGFVLLGAFYEFDAG